MDIIQQVLSNPIAQIMAVIAVAVAIVYLVIAWKWNQEDKNDKMLR